MKMWYYSKKEEQVGLSFGYGRVFVSSEKLFQLQTSWWSPQRSYLNHKCLSFLNRSQVLVSWGILGPIKAWWQWLSPPRPPQGSAPLLTSPLLPSSSSNGPAPEFWLVQQCTQKTLWGQCLFSRSSFPPCCLVLAQVGTYQRQSSSVMWPNHLDTHLACSSEDSYEYSRWCQRPVRGRKEAMRVTDNRGCVSKTEEKNKMWASESVNEWVCKCFVTQTKNRIILIKVDNQLKNV